MTIEWETIRVSKTVKEELRVRIAKKADAGQSVAYNDVIAELIENDKKNQPEPTKESD